MSRPENVRCENCCFWKRHPYSGCAEESLDSVPPGTLRRSGFCKRNAPTNTPICEDQWPTIAVTDFCGEFRSSWPTEESGERGPALRDGVFAAHAWVKWDSDAKVWRCWQTRDESIEMQPFEYPDEESERRRQETGD